MAHSDVEVYLKEAHKRGAGKLNLHILCLCGRARKGTGSQTCTGTCRTPMRCFAGSRRGVAGN